MTLYEDIKERLNEYEAPPVYERGNAPFESKRVPEDRIREEGYLYFSTHGTGPGTKPKDVRVREMDWDLPSGWVAIKTDRPLTGAELDYYDIQPETRNSEFRKRFHLEETEELKEAVNGITVRDIVSLITDPKCFAEVREYESGASFGFHNSVNTIDKDLLDRPVKSLNAQSVDGKRLIIVNI